MTAILLSIKPEFALAIFRGEKVYEFRKAVFKNRDVDKIYVYASAPISRVIGFFYINDILEMEPEALWSKTRCGAGISEAYFYEYFSGRDRAYALSVDRASLFDEPRKLQCMFGIGHPPQSFRYVPGHAIAEADI